MNKPLKTVVIGFLGPMLDRGTGPDRWKHWRPSVSICRHEELLVDRFELLCETHFQTITDTVMEDIVACSPETHVRQHNFVVDDPWDFEQVYGALHDFAQNYPFDTERERYLIHVTTGTHVEQICLFLLTESRHLPGQLLQSSPPRANNKLDPGRYVIIDLDLSRYDMIAQRFRSEQRQASEFLKAGIATRNAAFNRMIDEIEHVSIHSSAPILLTGPTGAGKSSLARRIFELKKQRRQLEGAFVEMNCATLRGDGAMSALFGHRRGAFTGALTDRAGHLCAADGGLLFLDEVGELGIDEQAMLLRAIEEKRFFPLGADREAGSDFQLICGTNTDLADAVRDGRFRHDLLARINMWTFELPGLAQRRDDIEPNIQFELNRVADVTGRKFRFNREAMDAFLKFAMSADSAWTGNFRDLSAAVARMSTMAPSGRITEDVVGAEIERLKRQWSAAAPALTSDEDSSLRELLGARDREFDEFDRVQLARVVSICRECDSLSAAGRRLFSVSRTRRRITNDADRLRKYLLKHGLTWDDLR